MRAAADGLVLFLLTVVLVWTLVFGISAATIATQRGKNGPAWFALGALFGPCALGYLWWDQRRGAGGGDQQRHQSPPAQLTEPSEGSSYFDL